MSRIPKCSMFATDCFAYGNGGVCKCLSDSDFGIKPCPFYKTVAQNEKERNEIKNRFPGNVFSYKSAGVIK